MFVLIVLIFPKVNLWIKEYNMKFYLVTYLCNYLKFFPSLGKKFHSKSYELHYAFSKEKS